MRRNCPLYLFCYIFPSLQKLIRSERYFSFFTSCLQFFRYVSFIFYKLICNSPPHQIYVNFQRSISLPLPGTVNPNSSLECEVVFYPSYFAPLTGLFHLNVEGGNQLELHTEAEVS